MVLPQPDGPSSVKNSFSRIVTWTSISASTAPSPWPKRLLTPATSIASRPVTSFMAASFMAPRAPPARQSLAASQATCQPESRSRTRLSGRGWPHSPKPRSRFTTSAIGVGSSAAACAASGAGQAFETRIAVVPPGSSTTLLPIQPDM